MSNGNNEIKTIDNVEATTEAAAETTAEQGEMSAEAADEMIRSNTAELTNIAADLGGEEASEVASEAKESAKAIENFSNMTDADLENALLADKSFQQFYGESHSADMPDEAKINLYLDWRTDLSENAEFYEDADVNESDPWPSAESAAVQAQKQEAQAEQTADDAAAKEAAAAEKTQTDETAAAATAERNAEAASEREAQNAEITKAEEQIDADFAESETDADQAIIDAEQEESEANETLTTTYIKYKTDTAVNEGYNLRKSGAEDNLKAAQRKVNGARAKRTELKSNKQDAKLRAKKQIRGTA